jgi:hypothetical protein
MSTEQDLDTFEVPGFPSYLQYKQSQATEGILSVLATKIEAAQKRKDPSLELYVTMLQYVSFAQTDLLSYVNNAFEYLQEGHGTEAIGLPEDVANGISDLIATIRPTIESTITYLEHDEKAKDLIASLKVALSNLGTIGSVISDYTVLPRQEEEEEEEGIEIGEEQDDPMFDIEGEQLP